MPGLIVFLLLSSQRFNLAESAQKQNDTEAADRPTLATEMSKAVLDCSYPDSASNRSYADVYNTTHRLPTQTTASPSGLHRSDRRTPTTSLPRGQGEDSRAIHDHHRSRGLDWDFFLRARRDRDEGNRKGWRGRRSTYDSRSTSLPACTVQCVFTRLDAVDDLGFVTEAGVLALLDNYVIDRKERLAKIRRVVTCFRKLGSASEDDHCAQARKMALCFALDMNQRP